MKFAFELERVRRGEIDIQAACSSTCTTQIQVSFFRALRKRYSSRKQICTNMDRCDWAIILVSGSNFKKH